MNGRPDDGNEFGLVSSTLGGLPIVNHLLDRLGLPALLTDAMPDDDARLKLHRDGTLVQTFQPELTTQQLQVLSLLGLSARSTHSQRNQRDNRRETCGTSVRIPPLRVISSRLRSWSRLSPYVRPASGTKVDTCLPSCQTRA